MSVENLGFPLPVKIEEDQNVVIDLDTEGNSPEDIVIEWHLEIRRLFGSYSAASGEIKLICIMKEYITAITERAIHFEEIVRLQDMVDKHIEHIYWFYKDSDICFSDICFSDMYLEYMEHILTFYVNLTLRVLLALKKKIKVTQKKVNEMTEKVIKRLSVYLLKSEHHIFHVLIRQTTSLVDGMIKDVINIMNSNMCKQMFRNLYMHFLVLTPVRDMSDEAFCRAYILFENWKAFEDYKQNEKIEECVKNIYNRDKKSIEDNEFLRSILMPQSSIMSELMKVMGCDPSITKAYFDHVKTKQKGNPEIIDDIGKLTLEDALLSETELTEEDDYETTYMELFNEILGDAEYNLEDIVLKTEYCKGEEDLSVPGDATVSDETEILISDSDSDVEIVSIVPSSNSTRQVPTTTRKQRMPVKNAQPTSFLESISLEVDTSSRKYGFRTLGNFGNLPPKQTTEANQRSTTTDKTSVPNTAEDSDSDLEVIIDKPTEPCLIIDDETEVDDGTNPSKTGTCTSGSLSNIVQSKSLTKDMSKTDDVTSTNSEDPENLLTTNGSSDLSEVPMELDNSGSLSASDVDPLEKSPIAALSKTVSVLSTLNKVQDDSTLLATETSAMQEESPVLKKSHSPVGIRINVSHIYSCSQLLTSPVLTDRDCMKFSDVVTVISSTTENVQVMDQRNASLEEISENGEGATLIPKNVMNETIVNNSVSTEASSNENVKETNSTDEIRTNVEISSADCSNFEEIDGNLDKGSEQTTGQSTPDEALENYTEVQSTDSLENTECVQSTIATENSKFSFEIHSIALSITSDSTVEHSVNRPKPELILTSVKADQLRVNGSRAKNLEQCQIRRRTLMCGKESEVFKRRTEPQLEESTECESGCGESDTTFSHRNINDKVQYISSIINREFNRLSEESTPLDTGQDPFVQPLDTGQFDTNSPASPDHVEVNVKSPCNKSEVQILGTDRESLLRKGQHGDFGCPTPPGSEEERDKDTDEQTKHIYSKILPTQTFDEPLTPKNTQNEMLQSEEILVVDPEINSSDTDLTDRLPDQKQTLQMGDANLSLVESYEQLVKDAVGSQNSTEDEVDEMPIVSTNCNKDQDQDLLNDMEQFLKNCGNEDFSQSNRKKPKRPREKTILEDIKARKNTSVRSCKRVKINEKPETHFITTSYDEDSTDDLREKQDSNEYDFSSSSDNEDLDSNRPRVKAKRRPSPMPLSNYLYKRNGAFIHPLSAKLSTDKPPPLKGILKRIEQEHTYPPLHPVDDEPETVVIVLHQRDVGKGKRGSVEVKVYRKSFSAYQIPFDDHKLCHHAYVKADRLPTAMDSWDEVFSKTRHFEEEMYNQPEKPMYKIVFDKKTPQLNSNDRKYYCDPSISSNSKPKSTLYENEQGTVNLSTEIAFVKTPEPVESIAEPAIQAPISPPCFSPSSNSSSEFSDPTNLIPYQDIERALQVVEPEKSGENAPSCSLKFHDENDSIEKSLVDRIALETIELLSNNADFHKMLRNLNGELLLENVPLIGIQAAQDTGNVAAVPDSLSNNDDLVSNLNSDEQLLKKVCQELESKALVDHFTHDRQNHMIVAESLLETAAKENCSDESTLILDTDEQIIEIESDQICYHIGPEMQVSSLSIIPNNSVPLQAKINFPPIIARSSPPIISSIPNSFHEGTISSLPNLTFTHSSQPYSRFAPNSPDPKQSSPLIPPVLAFHQDPYSSISHVSINQTSKSETNLSSSISSPVTSISLVPSLHQQTFSAIPILPLTHAGYTEAIFSSPLIRIPTLDSSNSNSLQQEIFSPTSDSSLIHSGYSEISAPVAGPLSSLIRISSPLVSPTTNSQHQETFSSNPDSSSILSGFSETAARVSSSPPAYSVSNSNPQTLPSTIKSKSFLPHSSSHLPVYTESQLGNASSTLPSYPQSNTTGYTSPVSINNDIKTKSCVHNFPATLPNHTETNCLIPNVPPFTEKNCIVPSSLVNVPPYAETTNPSIHSNPKHIYPEPTSDIPCISSKNALNSPYNNSDSHIPLPKILQTKTDRQRKRLPKEVLTISQLSESKSSNIDCIDNNSNWKTRIYPVKPKEFEQAKCISPQSFVIPNQRSQNTQLTDQFYKNTKSRDPRLGQPLICVPPPFIQGPNRSSLVVNLPVSTEMLKELRYKKSLSKNIKIPTQRIKKKLSIMGRVANKSISKFKITNSIRSRDTLRKVADATSLEASSDVARSKVTHGGFKNDTDASTSKSKIEKGSDSATSSSTPKNMKVSPTFSGVSKNVADTVQLLEAPVNVVFSATSLGEPKNTVDATVISDLPENVTDSFGTSLGVSKNDTIIAPFFETPRNVTDSATSLKISKKDLGSMPSARTSKQIAGGVISLEAPMEIFLESKSKTTRATPQNHSINNNYKLATDQGRKRTKSKTTGKKRGRPPKTAKSSSEKNGITLVQDNIPPFTKNIPRPSNHVIRNNYDERVPPIYHSDVPQRSYPATRNSTQPRVEPLKIVKDPKSKNGYNKVVEVNSSVRRSMPPLPMPVPETYNFETDTVKKEVYNLKPTENSEIEVEFETHLPLKKRKLSIPVPSAAKAQPTTLANVPRCRDKKEEISYPATPMLSIADVYMQPRTFKTPAEKKQLPPESSNAVPIHYEPPPASDTQFNRSLNTYSPAIYGFSKCPYNVELDCNPYCPPPVLFPPESFSHSN